MDEKELELAAIKAAEVIEARLAAKAEAVKAEEAKVTALKAAAVEEYKKTQVPAWKGGFATRKVVGKNDSGDEEMDAFWHYLRTGDEMAIKSNSQPMGESNSSDASYLVPAALHDRIQEKLLQRSWVRRAGVQIITSGSNVLDVPAEDTALVKFVRVAEQGAVDVDNPTITKTSITAHKWNKMIKVTDELLADQQANLDSFLTNSISRWMAETESYYAAYGTGSSQHLGVAYTASDAVGGDTCGDVMVATSDAITAAEVVSLAYKLNDSFRGQGVWLMNPATEGYLRTLSASTFFSFGQPYLSAEPGAGVMWSSLMGRPVFNSSAVPSYTGQASTTPILAFFDPSCYVIHERSGLQIRRLNELYAANGMVGINCTFRQGGAPVMFDGIAIMTAK